ncbi:MAG: DUF4230 domain-containing protein [Acidimicrobiales bacterium]
MQATYKATPIRSGIKLAVAALLIVALLPAALALSNLVSGLSNPFATTRQEKVQPAVLQSLQDLADYHAASANLQSVVEVSNNADYVPSFIVGDDAKLLAVGSVDAVVDFSNLGSTAVVVAPDGKSLTVTLPAPHLADPKVDLDNSQILSHSRGLLNRVGGIFSEDPTPDAGLYQLGSQALADAATQTDVVARAETNTTAMLTGMFQSAGFKKVTVAYIDPAAAR